jgi:dihydrofolate reductase
VVPLNGLRTARRKLLSVTGFRPNAAPNHPCTAGLPFASAAISDRDGAAGRDEFVTLDGVIEELMAADTLLLGRQTYEGFAAAWPHLTEDEFGQRMNGIPKYVVSTTLTEATWNNTAVLRGDPVEEAARLKAEVGKIFVAGSGRLVGALHAHGLNRAGRLTDSGVRFERPAPTPRAGELIARGRPPRPWPVCNRSPLTPSPCSIPSSGPVMNPSTDSSWASACAGLLLARKPLPGRLASHPEGLSDPRPGRPQRTGPSHPPRQMPLHLCARGHNPGQARQHLIDADRMLPGRKVRRRGGRAVNQLRAQRHAVITDEHPRPCHQPPYLGIWLQAERAHGDYGLLCHGRHHTISLSGYA